MMRWKWWLYAIGAALGLFAIVITGIVIWIMLQIPHPKDVTRQFAVVPPSQKTVPPRKTEQIANEELEKLSRPQTVQPPSRELQQLFQNWKDPDQPIEYCDRLKSQPISALKWTSRLIRQWMQPSQESVHNEPIRLMARYLMKNTPLPEVVRPMDGLLDDMIQEKPISEPTFWERVEFSSQILRLSWHVQTHRQEIERVVEMSRALMILGVIAKENPDVLDDPEFMQFCQSLEHSANVHDYQFETIDANLLSRWNFNRATLKQYQLDQPFQISPKMEWGWLAPGSQKKQPTQ